MDTITMVISILQRAGLRGVFLVLAIIAMIYFFIRPPKEDSETVETVVTSKELLNEMNDEREKQGLHEIPEVNSRSGGNTFARLDKSFKNISDFFQKLFSKK